MELLLKLLGPARGQDSVNCRVNQSLVRVWIRFQDYARSSFLGQISIVVPVRTSYNYFDYAAFLNQLILYVTMYRFTVEFCYPIMIFT